MAAIVASNHDRPAAVDRCDARTSRYSPPMPSLSRRAATAVAFAWLVWLVWLGSTVGHGQAPARWREAGDQAPAVLGDAVTLTSTPYLGITLVSHTENLPRGLRLHVARVDLRAPGVRVHVSGAGGGREAVRETTLDALTRLGAQLAVNGHFFLPFPSDDGEAWVIGFGASEGRVFSLFETPEQSYALVADAPALVFDRRQRARIVTRRPGGDGRRVRGRGALWTALSGSAQVVTDGRVTIPAYRDATHPRGVLTPGPDGRYDNARSWYDVPTARTVAGLSKDRRTLTLATADVRGGSEGVTVRALAERLVRNHGVWNALNLDGGGSTTMAWRDPATGDPALVNAPSDPNPGGRRVATSLLVFAPPMPAARATP